MSDLSDDSRLDYGAAWPAMARACRVAISAVATAVARLAPGTGFEGNVAAGN
jgi:hypothetical protein